MKKLLAGVTALVTVSATGCFGVGTASADDTPIGGPPTPGAPGDQTAYALGGAHVLGIPYDEYIRREGAEWFPGQKREIVRYPAGQVQGHVLERLFPGIGKIDESFPGLGVDGPSVGESVDEGSRQPRCGDPQPVAPVRRSACPRAGSWSMASRLGWRMTRPLPRRTS